MKKAIIVLFLTGIAFTLHAQFIFPSLVDSSMLNNTDGVDTPAVVKTLIKSDSGALNNQENVKEKDPIDDSMRLSEFELKKLEIRAQKARLEKEIAELTGKANLSPEEKEILKLKNENLKIVLQRERIMFEAELQESKRTQNQKNLPKGVVYGQDFFRDNSFTFFQKSNEVVATEGYVLGSGDVVQLEMWGYRYWSKSYVVSEAGSIDIAGYQKIFVKGLTLKQARDLIGSRLGINGGESSFSVTVTRPRMVTVNIMGEVFSPGSYTLPANNTAFNALVSMGGPTNIGSVRNIYIKRDGKIADSFDVYEYFADIRHQKDVYLQKNDYIIVMPLHNMVTVNGSIRRPGNYEMKQGEGLFDLVRFAGGNYPNTYLKDVVVSRIRNNAYEVLSVNLDSLRKFHKDFKLYGGETVYFKEVKIDNQYTVQISGAVSVPGTYRVRAGMRVSDLLKNANGLTSNAFMERGYIIRTNADQSKSYFSFNPLEILSGKAGNADIKVENRDTLYIFNNTELQKFYNVSINGAVYKPNTMRYISGLTLGDLFFMAGGLTEDADTLNGFIIRTNSDLDKKLIPFEPGKVARKSGLYDLELMPRDEVTVYSRTTYKKFYSVSVTGAVYKPSTFDYVKGMKLGDLMTMAGGLTEEADDEKGFIVRTNNEFDKSLIYFEPGKLRQKGGMYNLELEPRDEITILSKAALKRYYTLEIQGPVKMPKTVPYSENTRITDLINMAGGLEVTAYRGRALVIETNLETGYKNVRSVNLQQLLDNPSGNQNFMLSRNAVVRIFDQSELRNDFGVSLYGEVRRGGDFSYADNMTLQNLVDMAGGLKFSAAGTNVEVVRTFYLNDGKYQFLKPKIFFTKVNTSLQLDSQLRNMMLQPFDRVFIRKNPDYLPLKMVYIDGAVRYPGYYALQAENEKINNIYQRAGGFRHDAFIRGVKVKRTRKPGDTIELVLHSRKAIHHRRSNYNIIVKNGDYIYVPYAENIVVLTGDINKMTDQDLGVYYVKHKRAKFYIRRFGGGFTETSDKKHLVVIRADGSRVATRRVLFFRIYPRVKAGSKIVVNPKSDSGKGGKSKNSFNLDIFLSKLLTRATAVLSLIGLYRIAITK